MKKMILIIAMMFSASAALACPGGNVKTMAVKVDAKSELETIAELDMLSGEINVISEQFDLVFLTIASNKKKASEVICYTSMDNNSDNTACTNNQLVSGNLTSSPNSVVRAVFKNKNPGLPEIKFTLSNFMISKSMGCGEIVKPSQI